VNEYKIKGKRVASKKEFDQKIAGLIDENDAERFDFTEENIEAQLGGVSQAANLDDVNYKDIPISHLFDEPFARYLGKPSSVRGSYHFYDGIEITAEYNSDTSSYEMMEQIQGTNLSLFSINGVTLDKTRAELIAAFGKPLEYYKYEDYEYKAADSDSMMRYHISSFVYDYMLDIWFDTPDSKASSIIVKRMGI
jgi:hypothetical protein